MGRHEAELRATQRSANMGDVTHLWKCEDYLSPKGERKVEIVGTDANYICSKRLADTDDRCMRNPCPLILHVLDVKAEGMVRGSEDIPKIINKLCIHVSNHLRFSNTKFSPREHEYAIIKAVEHYISFNIDPKK